MAPSEFGKTTWGSTGGLCAQAKHDPISHDMPAKNVSARIEWKPPVSHGTISAPTMEASGSPVVPG
jgi:hypothetical protein